MIVGIDDDLARIEAGLDTAVDVLTRLGDRDLATTYKDGDDPVTVADVTVDDALRRSLPLDGDGWLSEETADSRDRLGRSRVWIVDPIDGTREFVEGIPEWTVSIGLVVDGTAVAGGIHNPATGERIVGAVGVGVTYEGARCPSRGTSLLDASVCASRSEVRRGEWSRFEGSVHHIVPTGSVAYKLALVAAGRLDATWTLLPKHEWDLAAGAALVVAAGGWVSLSDGSTKASSCTSTDTSTACSPRRQVCGWTSGDLETRSRNSSTRSSTATP